MSDSHDIPGRKTPTRAEAIQPDKPGVGNGAVPNDAKEGTEDAADKASKNSSADQQKQSGTALDNVREGYGGSGAPAANDNSMVPGRPATDAQ